MHYPLFQLDIPITDIRKIFLFILTIVLFSTSTVSVYASPTQQDPQDMLIRQALAAIQQELGWSVPIDYSQDSYPGRYLIKNRETGIPDTHLNGLVYIFIWTYESASELENRHPFTCGSNMAYEVFKESIFHGKTACSKDYFGATTIEFSIDRFYFEVWDYQESGLGAEAYLEVAYRNFVAHGLITEGSTSDPTESPATITPDVPVTPSDPTVTFMPGETPQIGGTITLVASAIGYNSIPMSFDNSEKSGSTEISGFVFDEDTGDVIVGATIEIVSGAPFASTQTDTNGYYLLTVVDPQSTGRGVVQYDFSLQKKREQPIIIIPDKTELLADGSSTSKMRIIVIDLQGKPVKDRTISLMISSEDGAGPGTIYPSKATTDANGEIFVTYTAFKPDPGLTFATDRHEITLSVRDNVANITVYQRIYVSQYHLDVQYNSYLPACEQECNFPVAFKVSVLDPWNKPVPNVGLTFSSMTSFGKFIYNSYQEGSEFSLDADANGEAVVYYNWEGYLSGSAEEIQSVSIQERVTNASVIKDVRVQALELGITRIEEAGFTGYTGQQAFIKVYFQDYAQPSLELERFNIDAPHEMALRVEISRVNKDGNNKLVYDYPARWEHDDGGMFVTMIDTPHMPYVIPVIDGSNWFNISVRPQNLTTSSYLHDAFLPNNDTIFALNTGSDASWLHTFLKDGALTPHNWFGVVFKCVARFLPGIGETINVIDYLTYIYAKDSYALGQNTAAMITEELRNRADTSIFTKVSAKKLNDVIQCLQDIYRVYNESDEHGSSSLGGVCAMPVRQGVETVRFEASDEDAAMVRTAQDRFVQGMLHDSPDLRGVVVVGLDAEDVILRDSSGQVVSDAERMSAEGRVSIYLLPVDENFQLEVTSDRAFDIGVYEVGDDDSNRKTIRHEIQSEARLLAKMAVGATSAYDLELDTNNDGVFDQIMNAQNLTLDVVKPLISNTQPEADSDVSAGQIVIIASYVDNPGGVGIDPQGIAIYVDDVDRTSDASVGVDRLNLMLPNLRDGVHTVRMVISDMDGNATVEEWAFTVKPSFFLLLENNAVYLFGGCSCIMLLVGVLLVGGFTILFRRKRTSRISAKQRERAVQHNGTVQDSQGCWWYQDPNNGSWSFWNGTAWQLAPPGSVPLISSQPKIHR